MQFEDIVRSLKEKEENRKEAAKSDLVHLLTKRTDIARVQVEYDGCGDSGTIDHITYLDKDGTEIAADDINDSVEEYVYAMLPSGWEINEGSYGKVEIDVTTGNAHVVHTQRVVEEYTEEFEA